MLLIPYSIVKEYYIEKWIENLIYMFVSPTLKEGATSLKLKLLPFQVAN